MKKIIIFLGALAFVVVTGSTIAFAALDIPITTIWIKNAAGTACASISIQGFQATTQALAQVTYHNATLTQPSNLASCSLTIYLRSED